MANFDYTGRNPAGQLITGQVEASDSNGAARVLMQRSLIPVKITPALPKDDSEKETKGNKMGFFVPKVALADLVIFCRQMYSLTKAGIPMLRAVSGLADSTGSVRLEHALRDVVVQLEKGRTLSSALNAHSDIFNQLFVSIVHVGENTGKLDAAFLQLSVYMEREQETRKQMKAATRYPMFVMAAIVVALFVLNIFVIPTFAEMFRKLGADLPLMTQILIGMSDFFVAYWLLIIVAMVAMVIGLRYYLNTPDGRLWLDKRLLRAPIAGPIIERSVLSRFSRSFAMMLSAGVPMTSALTLVADAVGNRYVGDNIGMMRKNIERGDSLSKVARNSGLFTPLVLQMITVGEETGRIDELLAEVAEYYEREVDYDVKNLTAKIEPVLISVVAVMVLVLALGIFTPMWDMMGAYKG